MFVVARRNPRPPALNDCPLIAACSSDNYSWLLFWLKHASHKRSLQWPWAIGQHFCGAPSKPIFFKDTVICLSARRNPRPPALNDCPLIAACSSDNYSWLLFWLKHASHKRSLQWPWAIGQHFCGAPSKPIFFKDTVICLSAKFICLLFCVHMTDVILKYTH